ncbi:chloride transport protein 6-like, partial [Notechis scutatus]|uniref:Chloride transport protein 6-like n=1 Tax=Notechis scutatus TaxID=8663 RepID=A0A6J1VZG1_9SAUR
CPESNKKCHLWTIVDLGFFILMGVGGGLLGATFNCINKRLAKYRMRNVHPKPKLVRVLESLLVCLTTTLVIFVASMLLGECRPLSSADHGDNSSALSLQDSSSEEVNSSIKTFFCHNNTYNDMATLFFNPQESAILQLFHQEGECLIQPCSFRSCEEKNGLFSLFLCLPSSVDWDRHSQASHTQEAARLVVLVQPLLRATTHHTTRCPASSCNDAMNLTAFCHKWL